MAVGETDLALSRTRILQLTGGAIVSAGLILFGAVLPAEYHLDPTGLGKLTGTAKLWAPAETQAPAAAPDKAPPSREYPTPFRSDEVEIALKPGGDPERGDELEYKAHLKKGASYVYSWEVVGPVGPEDVYIEFHGHTLATPDKMTVAYYKKDFSRGDNGVLTAPFDGIHGWYFQNQSVKPVKIRLRLAGFYDVIPPGAAGNESGLAAKRIE